MSDPSPYGPMGAIEVRTSFFPLAFVLALFPARATINGSAELDQGWGVRVYPIPAGRHQVRVWCPYFFVFNMGDATHVVDVAPGQATVVAWRCPWLVFLPGTWTTLGARPVDATTLPAGPGHGGVVPAAPAAPAPGPGPGPGPVPPSATSGPPGPAVGAGPPPGWHPDPHGVAPLRYWDGTSWTAHTSDGRAGTG